MDIATERPTPRSTEHDALKKHGRRAADAETTIDTTAITPEIRPQGPEHALSMEQVEALRKKQWDMLAERRKTRLFRGNPETINQEFMLSDRPASIEQHLDDAGITKDDPKRAEYRQLLNEYSINPLDGEVIKYGDDWNRKGADGQTRRKAYETRHNEYFNPTAETTVIEPTAEAQESDNPFEFEVSKRAADKHRAFADKVNGPAWGKGKKQLLEDYKQAEAAYLAALKTQIEAEITAEGYDVAKMPDYITKLVNERAITDADAQHIEITKSFKGRMMEKYANLSRGKKIMATIGMAGIGASAGVLMGAFGAGIATVGFSVAAYRFGGSYGRTLSKIYQKDKYPPAFTFDTGRDIYEQANDFLSGQSDEKIKQAESIKKKALVYALGATAAGSVFGVGLHLAGDAAAESGGIWDSANNRFNDPRPYIKNTDLNPDTSHWPAGFLQHIGDNSGNDLGRFWNGASNAVETPPDSPAVGAEPGAGEKSHADSRVRGDDSDGILGNDGEATAPVVAEARPNTLDTSNWRFGADEIRLSKEEGLYSTFKQMGIDSGDHERLSKAVGDKLRVTYWDENAGEWRQKMTDNGKITKKDIETIARAAYELNIDSNYEKFIEKELSIKDVGVDSDTPPARFDDSVYDMRHSESPWSTLEEMNVPAEDRMDVIHSVADELYADESGIVYENTQGNKGATLPGFDMTENGRVPASIIDTLHDGVIETGSNDDLTEASNDNKVPAETTDTNPEPEKNVTTDAFTAREFGQYSEATKAYHEALSGVHPSLRSEVLEAAGQDLLSINMNGEPLSYLENGQYHFQEATNLSAEALEAIAAAKDKVAERYGLAA